MATESRPITEARAACAICLEGMDHASDRKIAKLACGHEFHPLCIDEWLNHKPTCPLCRAPVVKRNEAPALDQPPQAILIAANHNRVVAAVAAVAAVAMRAINGLGRFFQNIFGENEEEEVPQLNFVDETQANNLGKSKL